MLKFAGGVVLGIFVGALTVEVLERTFPSLRERIRDEAKKVQDRARVAAEQVQDAVRRRAAASDNFYDR